MKIIRITFLLVALSCLAKNSQSQPVAYPSYKKMQPLPVVQQPVFKKDTFNIKAFGAKADGVSLCTDAINKAINACSSKGGGVVYVPTGVWITGPIIMKSNVNLNLAPNSLLQFTADKAQYKLIETNWEGEQAMRNESPLSATNVNNIAITGAGIIDGNGDAWRAVKKEKLTATQWKTIVASGGLTDDDKKMWFPSASYKKGNDTKNPSAPGKTAAEYESMKDFYRPNLLVFTSCNKVLLEGVTFQNSPAWCLHPLMCQDLTIRNVYAKNPWYAQNGDGIDIESCKNVLLENSTFDVGDDGICIKSGRDASGRKRGMPTENVIVRYCTVYHAHGGFVIGSEMSGGARNIWVSDCTFMGTDIGLRFKTTRGRGGIVENIYVDNTVMKDIVAEAILFDMYYMAKDPVVLNGEKREDIKVETFPVTEETPQFRKIYIDNVVCLGASKAIFVRGLPEMNIKDISMQHIVITADKGIEITEGQNILMKDVQVILKNTNPVADVHNSSGITFDNLKYNNGSELLFSIRGEKSADVTVKTTDTKGAKTKSAFADGAIEKALSIK